MADHKDDKKTHDHKDGHDHDHDHDDDHDHDHDHDDGKDGDHKASRGEKKFKKAMMKMGLKPVDNINRVTLKTNKGMIMYIEEPFVMKSSDTAYVVFGEAKFLDMAKALAEKQAGKFAQPEAAAEKQPKLEEIKEEKEDDGPEDTTGLKEEDINSLISYVNCSRAKAIKALRASNGDVVDAITKLS